MSDSSDACAAIRKKQHGETLARGGMPSNSSARAHLRPNSSRKTVRTNAISLTSVTSVRTARSCTLQPLGMLPTSSAPNRSMQRRKTPAAIFHKSAATRASKAHPEVRRFDEFRVETFGCGVRNPFHDDRICHCENLSIFGFDTHKISKGSLPVSSAGS